MSSALDKADDVLNAQAIDDLLHDVEELAKESRLPTGQETRVVDAKTGGAKGSKLARYDLLPNDAMDLLAEHYGRGAFKYADRNWEKGYAWGLSYAALQRHLSAHWQGEVYDYDPFLYGVDDDGQPLYTVEEIENFPEEELVLHITAVMWHAAALTAFFIREIGTDDRPVTSG